MIKKHKLFLPLSLLVLMFYTDASPALADESAADVPASAAAGSVLVAAEKIQNLAPTADAIADEAVDQIEMMPEDSSAAEVTAESLGSPAVESAGPVPEAVIMAAETDASVTALEAGAGTEAAASDFAFDPATGIITGYSGLATAVAIPDQIDGVAVTNIGDSAFRRKGLTSVVIPEGIETIGKSAFGNNNLTTITFPDTVKFIGSQSFSSNPKLTTINFGKGLETIDTGAFILSGVETLTFPAALTTINNMAFANNKSLKHVNFNEGLAFIGQQAFVNSSALAGEIILPATLEHLMTSAFSGTGVTGLRVLGDADTNHLTVHSGISPDLNQIRFDDPGKHADVVFNLPRNADTTVNIDLGRIDAQAANADELKQFLRDNINVKFAAIYVDQNDASGASDYVAAKDLPWDTASVDFSADSVKLVAEPQFVPGELPAMAGFTTPSVENSTTRNIFNLTVNLLAPANNAVWNQADFNYGIFQYKGSMQVPQDKFGIASFSDSGLEKIKHNPHLVIPKSITVQENGQAVTKNIEGVLPHAFENLLDKIKSVDFPETVGEYDFVIGDSAFHNAGLESVEFKAGLKSIESGAFTDNSLASLFIPATVAKIGNSAFGNNQLADLVFSDDVEAIQLDNYAFEGNQLKEVKLPYSVFKFLDYVFKGNPGMEPLPADQLLPGDAAGTGVVYLYTRNGAHLDTSTYIHPSPYHKIMLVSGAVKRDELWSLIKSSNHVNFTDYLPEHVAVFNGAVAAAKTVFADEAASQTAITASATDLAAALGALRNTAPDKTILRDLLIRADEFVSALFTEDSWSVVQQEIQAAKAIADNNRSTIDEIQQATTALQAAIDNIVISEKALYTAADFTYADKTITGFSDSGQMKFEFNKNVVLPTLDLNGQPIEIIGAGAFRMPDEWVKYGADVVESPYGIQSVVLPATVKRIEADAFRLNNLKTVELPDGLLYIGSTAFNGNQLESLMLPDSVTALGTGAFSLNQLKSLILSKGLTEIASGAFSRNIYLTEVIIPDGVTKIGSSAFMGVPLAELNLPASVSVIDRSAFNGHRLTTLAIPGTVKEIASSAFAQNVKFRTLTKLILEEGILNIGTTAFKSALLQTVNLPHSLLTLGTTAFSDNMDANKAVISVKLYTGNETHLAFNTDSALKNQEVILLEMPVIIDQDYLQQAIAAVKPVLDEAKYLNATKDNRKAFDKALKAAEKMIVGKKATQTEIENSLATLQAAYEALDGVPLPDAVGKGDLQQVITLVKPVLDEAKYLNATKDNRKAFDKALKAAEKMIAHKNISQAEIDSGLAVLQATYAELDGIAD